MLVALSALTAAGCAACALVEAAAERFADTVGDSCIISLLSVDGRWLHQLGIADPEPEVTSVLAQLGRTRLRADRGFARRVLSTRAPVRLARTSPGVLAAGRPELADYAQRFGLRSLVVVPMRARGRALGQVALMRRGCGGSYSADDERFVQLVADWLALGIEGAGASGGDRESGGHGLTGDLSCREREILVLLALGHTNREVAERLVLSVRTVEWHRARMQEKLGVSGRAALARVARCGGLLD